MSTTVLSIYAMHALFRFCIHYLNDAWSRSTNPNVRNKASLVLIPYESQIGVPCSMFDVAYNVKLSKEEEYRHAVLGFIRWFNMSAKGDKTKMLTLNVKRKKQIDNSRTEFGKRCQNIFYWVKKRLVWVFQNRGDRDKYNETGLKEGEGIEMSIYSASIHSNDNYNSSIVTQ